MQIRFLIIYIFLCLSFLSHSQEYNYQHYDLTNGLSGLTVYNIAQDKNSYLWFATETGVSRFDGINFKNFTTSDGLPDNEVLKLYVDSKNRVWMLPFTNSICYYENGKIHSPENDTTLAKIKFTEKADNICEDADGNIAFIESSSIIIIDIAGNIHYLQNYKFYDLITTSIGKNRKGNIIIAASLSGGEAGSLSIFELNRKDFSLTEIKEFKPRTILNTNVMINQGSVLAYLSTGKMKIGNIDSVAIKEMNMPEYFTSFSYLNDSFITINCSNKILLYDLRNQTILSEFKIGTQVNSCFKDSENNYWFATNGYGIYRLSSVAFKNYEFYFNNNPLPVYSILKRGNIVLSGTNNALIWKADLLTDKLKYSNLKSLLGGRVTSMLYDNDKLIVGGNGLHIISNDKNDQEIMGEHSVKSIFQYDNNFLISTSKMVFQIAKDNQFALDTIWHYRATCAYKFDSLYYIGTIAGLHEIDAKGKERFIGKQEPLLASRISQITKTGDTLWIATYGNGVVAYAFDTIVAHITDHDGLTSNMCRTIEIYNNKLLVGTDKGLNIISLDLNHYKISSYNASNGLICDIVNCTYTDHDTIYVGTPYGLTFFNPSEVDNYSIAVLNIDNIASRKYKWTTNDTAIHLSPDDNRLYTEFSCVSFKSQGNISYYYRLIGADDQWHTTKENKLDFPSLSSGDYKLELYAVNAFGKESNRITIEVTVEKYFYQQAWFILLLSLSLLSILWLFISKRIEKIRSNENEKLLTQKRLSELEQLAFRAQMNPHFIFNCLNSIQQYIFSKNAIDANRFITEFASLIRQTMDLSAQKLITIDEEIKFLTTYLKLEHTRFEKNFDYDILVDKAIDAENIYIPSLLLQPFLENSIRHGIRNLKDKKGKIFVIFSLEDHFIICRIEDNGIGIAAARALKNGQEHESKGIALIQKRIEVLNSENSRNISLHIENGFQNEPNAGTTVILHIPDNL